VVTTIEGVAEGDRLHRLQEAFLAHGGYQCGICTPGQILAAKALLDVNPHPTRDEIRHWMMGNLCRCTGYYKIIDAIAAAAGVN
jgi:carbon-monoxide dehydrogenase small subunit